MTVRLADPVAFAQIGIVGLDGQIELEALRLYGLPEGAPALLCGTPTLPVRARLRRRDPVRPATSGRRRGVSGRRDSACWPGKSCAAFHLSAATRRTAARIGRCDLRYR
jgi:hypothetical protein